MRARLRVPVFLLLSDYLITSTGESRHGRSAVPGAKSLTSTSGHVVVAAAVLTQSSDLN